METMASSNYYPFVSYFHSLKNPKTVKKYFFEYFKAQLRDAFYSNIPLVENLTTSIIMSGVRVHTLCPPRPCLR